MYFQQKVARMKKYLPIIKNASLFAGISEAEIGSMLTCLDARTREYRKGEAILRDGDSVESVGLLLSGGALIGQEDFWGNRNLLAGVTAGQLFAEAFACSPGAVSNVSVVASERCVVLWLNVKRILTTCPTACSHHSRVIRNLLGDLADKNLRFNEKLTHMGQRSTREKLMSYLSAEARKNGSPEFDIPFSRQQLADYLSVERSAMSAELGRLRDQGALRFERNHFILAGAGAVKPEAGR